MWVINSSKRTVSAETRKKISNANKGRKPSTTTRAIWIKQRTGKKQSKETVNKRIEKLTGQIRTKEQRQNISKSLKGKRKGPQSESTKNKKSDVLKGRFRGKQSSQFKGFYHTPSGKFASAALASEFTGINQIHRWCKIEYSKIINNIHYKHSQYLQNLGVDVIGQTFEEVGFWFEVNT